MKKFNIFMYLAPLQLFIYPNHFKLVQIRTYDFLGEVGVTLRFVTNSIKSKKKKSFKSTDKAKFLVIFHRNIVEVD